MPSTVSDVFLLKLHMFTHTHICKHANMHTCTLTSCTTGALVQPPTHFTLDRGVKSTPPIDRNFFCGHVYNTYYLNDVVKPPLLLIKRRKVKVIFNDDFIDGKKGGGGVECTLSVSS